MEAWRLFKNLIIFQACLAAVPPLLSLFLGIDICSIVNFYPPAVQTLMNQLEAMRNSINQGSIINLFSLPITVFLVIINMVWNILLGNPWIFTPLKGLFPEHLIDSIQVVYSLINMIAMASFLFYVITNRNIEFGD